jgi:hypothetical protein
MLLLAGPGAMALGLGRVSTLSSLGAPLEFSIAVSSTPADALAADCIQAQVYAGDTRVPPAMVRLLVNRGPDGAASSVRISTGVPVDEPVASVELVLNCGTRITRKYVVFIDPPQMTLAESSPASDTAQALAPVPRERASREARGGSAARRARSESPRRYEGLAPGGTGSVASARRQERQRQRADAAKAAKVAAATVERGSRLKLESAPAVSTAAPVTERSAAAGAGTAASAAASSAGLPRAAASAVAVAAAASAASSAASAASGAGGLLGELAARADADAIALNAERLRALEERVNRMRTDNQSLQKSLAELQARLSEAESRRYANPLVYGLVAALVLLLLAVIALLWRQSNLRRESDWLKAATAEGGDGGPPPAPREPVRPSNPSPVVRTTSAAAGGLTGTETAPALGPRLGAASLAADAAADDAPAAIVSDPPPPVAASPAVAHDATSVHAPGREVTVEELIDLEQQADFFVVLGQDDAAIDLLMGHVQGTGGASPLPYLKLLEIHRRRDEREAYDRVRERFNRRFGAFAPEWDAHTGHDRALEDYPAVVERLQGLWPRPTEAMEALAGLLFQRDPNSPTFDLPAYGELLFLYSLARERAESEPPPEGVDLLLPLDDGPSPAPAPVGKAGLGLAAAGAGALGAAALAAGSLDDLSLEPRDGASAVPDIPPTYPVPLGFAPSPNSDLPALDDGLLDLNISDEPEEPKGPLSRY